MRAAQGCLALAAFLAAVVIALREPRAEPARAGRWSEVRLEIPARLAAGRATRGRVLVYVPASIGAGPAPLLIALHGWDGHPDVWQEHPRVARLAEEHKVIVACPDLGRSVYEARFYPESRGRWSRVPGAVFIGEVVLPALRARFPVRQDRGGTAILGYSTGGRGAVVVAQRYAEFAFVASLSGTYDLGLLRPSEGEYKIHAVVLGPRARHPARWRDEDVVGSERAEPLRGALLYLAHGGADRVVDVSQLRAMERFSAQRGLRAELVVEPSAGHNWQFWEAQLPPVFVALAREVGGAPRPAGSPW
jgi:S-formylglutathione hydrolase FrmB